MKRQRLLIQITAIVLPLFALMTAAVIYIVYSSTVNGFLEAQNDHIKEIMPGIRDQFVFLDEEKDSRVTLWFLDQLKKADFDYSKELTDEQVEKMVVYEDEPNCRC